jgi:hypothetical protein
MSRRKPKRKPNILIENPPVTSLAAYYRLVDKLASEAGYKPFKWWVWVKFRAEYLNNLQRLYGMLWCEYCGKHPLQINGEIYNNSCVATLDHIKAVANGGAIYDEDNLAVSCRTCNQDKGDLRIVTPRLYPYEKETLSLLERSMYVETTTKTFSW